MQRINERFGPRVVREHPFFKAGGTFQTASLLSKEENFLMCLHTVSSMESLTSAVKVLQSFLDRSSSGTYSTQLVQQCLSFSFGLRVAFERLMAVLLVLVWARSVILELSWLNHEVRLLFRKSLQHLLDRW